MKIKDIPQEANKTFEGAKKALYAQDDNGEYKIAASTGWKVEELATLTAIEELKEQENAAFKEYIEGKLSPLPYYMHKRRMDLPTLACTVGMFKWRIKRHFKPSVFKKLSNKILMRYAEALDIKVEDLTQGNSNG
ncbi:MAG: hypothetical protein LBF13_03390 [Campylobacteraceae bacterium]|jgi:hypothetical protein|nr:hypothetical protein [Campylobacteraceae bacterium]